MKPPGENKGKTLQDMGMGKAFSGPDPKGTGDKSKRTNGVTLN
jgi:hypothetical protein